MSGAADWAVVEDLLTPLLAAGWMLPGDETWGEEDEDGRILVGTLRRNCSAADFEFATASGRLTLAMYEGYDEPWLVEMLDTSLMIDAATAGAVEAAAGEAGLLDPTYVESRPDCDETAQQLTARLFVDHVLEPAADYRGISLEEAADSLDGDREFSGMYRWLMFSGCDRVLPEFVPSAVALGIGGYCWRNNTEVENEHHRISDAQMAKTNIAAVRAAIPHLDSEGVDWPTVEGALCDPDRRLADGRPLADLFGESWSSVIASVRAQVHLWRRFDEELLGPDGMLVLLSIAGASEYVRHWWGQGRWPSIVRSVVEEAVAADLSLPAPYDETGAEALIRDCSNAPDRLTDDVLEWIIDPPTLAVRGLRMSNASQPIIRSFYC